MPETYELPAGYDHAALERCIDLFFGQLEHPDRVTITLTSDFTKTVKELVEDKAYADAYEQDRPLAFAVAKTITQADGSITLVVDINLFLDGAPYGKPEESFAHEALHVITTERDETLSDLRLRHLGEALPVQQDLIAMAGVAAEEFRVERAVWASGQRQSSEHLLGIEHLGRIFYNDVRRACRQYQRDLDIAAVAKGVIEPFHALATSTGYVAAELASSGVAPTDLNLDGDLEDLVFGEPWRDVLVELQRLPAADAPTQRVDLDAIAFDIASKLEPWLKHIGFLIRAEGDDETYFEILRPYQWALSGFKIDSA